MPKQPEGTAKQRPGALSVEETYRTCDPTTFAFPTTADLPPLVEIIGQERAVNAIDFGVGIRSHGYNIFALGAPGTGKTRTVNEFLEREAENLPIPADYVYVHNFDTPHRPNAIKMPPGHAGEFRSDMETLVEALQSAISQAFESEEYENQKREIQQKVSEQQETRFKALKELAESRGFTIMRTPAGLAFAPRTTDGQPMPRELYNELPKERQEEIDKGLEQLNEELQDVMRQVRQDERHGREAQHNLDREVSTFAAQHLVEDLADKWKEVDEIAAYLEAVLKDVVANANDFRKRDEDQPVMIMGVPIPGGIRNESTFRRYRVNVLVDNSSVHGAPIVNESNPTFQNLVGRVEHMAQFGALVTDFNMIKPGALHAANGGFLVLEARDILTKPYAWDALKRTLKTGQVNIEDIAQQMGWATTSTLDPEPIPFSAKIVIMGEPYLYYLLYQLDPDFQELFKVKADFDMMLDRTEDNEHLYCKFVGHICQVENLPHLTPEAVARVVEQASRLVEDQRKLSVRFADLADLVREAAYWALHSNGHAPDTIVKAEHVERAINEHIRRANRIEERVREVIADGTIMVDTEGAVVGQINALSVSSTGDYAWGQPSRVTATHRLGDGELINIEREVDMSGPIHSKGVLILAGYLGARYAADQPLSINARLVFEQSYGGVDGDSASSTELYALLSSLSGLPIQQRFAVTGSVNQRGQVQPIGGVNEKIEGFFAICKAKGLRGDEGVLIPRTNVPNLMLRSEVRDAIAAGTFHIYPISTIDEGIALMTATPAGEADENGVYPEGTVNRMVADRLADLTAKARALREDKSKPRPKKKPAKGQPKPQEDPEI
ncbi:MAG: AAA family ATPase [Actinobacteria bacterium]|nr:AAA family ATPase [Actinomycetota bacterium]